ncbi:MAG: AraC family transcriptional regulator [Gammaproteobacteria bacterium]|nr:AraC family transcriptional regulator [Gammaproteobacteria bacterium]
MKRSANRRSSTVRRKRAQAVYLFGSTMLRPYRLAFGLAPIIEVLEAHGHAVAPLLDETGIPRFALEEPSYRIQFEQELAFIRLALRRLELPTAGLLVGQCYTLALFGVLGLAASCAPTMRDLFRTVPSYPALAWGSIELSVWREGAEEYVAFYENDEVGDCANFFVERDTTVTLVLFRQTLGADVAPVAVSFRRPAPPDVRPYAAFFRCPVRFGEPVNEIRFPRALWEAQPPQANAMSFRFFENQCRQLAAVMHEPLCYADIVRSRLRAETPVPSLVDLVKSLHLTKRTLQRRLDDEGTTFSALLTEVRLERARELIRRSGMHHDEIARALGFDDASAFSRAFKTWTGVSPQTYRQSTQFHLTG